MDERHELETVFTGTPVEAGLARGFLEENGLPAFLAGEYIGTAAPYMAAGGGAGAVQVQVGRADAVQARALLADRPGPV